MYIPTNCGPSTANGVTASASDVCTGVVVSNRFVITCGVICVDQLPVVIFNARFVGGEFLFSFASEANKSYRIEFTDSLLPIQWQSLGTVMGTGGILNLVDTTASTQRFYRIVRE